MPHNTNQHDTPLDEAIQRWWRVLAAGQALEPLSGESVSLAQAVGRITAEPVWAKLNSPHYHAAAMDGFAVQAGETTAARPDAPTYLHVDQQALPVDTGDPMPDGYNAVIMLEEARQATRAGDGQTHLALEVLHPVAPWRHVRQTGEDIRAGTLIVPSNHRLRPADIGAIAGAGHADVLVRRRPHIAILPTGSELVEPGASLKPGDIIEYNSLMLAAAAQEAGALATRLPKVDDGLALIQKAVADALQTYDLVIVNAGSSAGREDYTAAVFRALGEVVVQGIAIRPGHPTLLAYADIEVQGSSTRQPIRKALAGLPGYPVSAAITFDLLIKPLLAAWQGQITPEAPQIEAVLTQAIESAPNQDEFLRVSLAQVGKRIVAIPLTRSAGMIMSMVRADGLIHLPRGHIGYRMGDTVTVAMQTSLQQIRNTVIIAGVIAGPSEQALELLADELGRQYSGLRLLLHVTDAAGAIRALVSNQAHLVVSYLRDRGTGEYNLPSIQQPALAQPVQVVRFVEHRQRLMDRPIDLLMAGDQIDDEKMAKILTVIQSESFKQRIQASNGYKINHSGEVIAQITI